MRRRPNTYEGPDLLTAQSVALDVIQWMRREKRRRSPRSDKHAVKLLHEFSKRETMRGRQVADAMLKDPDFGEAVVAEMIRYKLTGRWAGSRANT